MGVVHEVDADIHTTLRFSRTSEEPRSADTSWVPHVHGGRTFHEPPFQASLAPVEVPWNGGKTVDVVCRGRCVGDVEHDADKGERLGYCQRREFKVLTLVSHQEHLQILARVEGLPARAVQFQTGWGREDAPLEDRAEPGYAADCCRADRLCSVREQVVHADQRAGQM